MKPYKSYKEATVPWLDIIPTHWELLRNKNVLIEKKESVGTLSANYTLLSLTLNGVIRRNIESGKGKFPKKFDTYKIVKNNEIIFCLFDIDETPRTVGLSKMDGMITGAYDVFATRNINNKFLYYYYLALDTVKAMKPLYTGLRKVINVSTFLAQKIPVPPRAEQDRIVSFLDEKISKIDLLIESKKKQIELLKEHKQAGINKVVTKGLNDDAPMKDSGVSWLGYIPSGWATAKIKHISNLLNEKSYSNGGIYIGMENIESWTGKYIASDNTPEGLCNRYTQNCLLFGKLRPYLAKVYITRNDGFCSSELLVLKSKNVSIDYLQYVMLTPIFIDLVNSSTYGAKMPRANWNFIGNIQISIPPITEQYTITTYIKNKTEKIDKIIESLKEQIIIHEEYKTSLISSCVTGRINISSEKK